MQTKIFLCKILGLACLVLAFIGVMIPVMPGTPFLLLSAYFFSKSSPQMYRYLRNNKFFGETIASWEDEQCIPCLIKKMAVCSVIFFGGTSIVFFIGNIFIKISCLFFIVVGVLYLLRIPCCEEKTDSA